MTNALARLDTTSILVSGDFDDMKQKAQTMIRSGLLPHSIRTPEQFIVIAFHAVELGLPVMYAMRHISVINGNPTADAQAMAGIIEEHFGDNAIVVTEQTPTQATVRVMKPGWKEPQFVTYTMAEAVAGKVNMSWDKEKKQWVEKHAWKSHPTDMLRSRAVSRAARTYFPASIGGLYTPEELGADVTVNDDGSMQIVDVTPYDAHEAVTGVPERWTERAGEMVDHETGEIIDAGVTEQPATPRRGPEADASANQIRFIESLARDAGMDADAVEKAVESRYGRTLHGLSKSEASDFIEALQAINAADSDDGAAAPAEPAAPQKLPAKFVLRLEELATDAGLEFAQMDADAEERYERQGYAYLTVDEATDYAAWLKALAEEQAETETAEVEAEPASA